MLLFVLRFYLKMPILLVINSYFRFLEYPSPVNLCKICTVSAIAFCIGPRTDSLFPFPAELNYDIRLSMQGIHHEFNTKLCSCFDANLGLNGHLILLLHQLERTLNVELKACLPCNDYNFNQIYQLKLKFNINYSISYSILFYFNLNYLFWPILYTHNT